MGYRTIHKDGKYLLYSTYSDSPVHEKALELNEYKDFYIQYMLDLEKERIEWQFDSLIKRAESRDFSSEISCNRAGVREKELSEDDFIDIFFLSDHEYLMKHCIEYKLLNQSFDLNVNEFEFFEDDKPFISLKSKCGTLKGNLQTASMTCVNGNENDLFLFIDRSKRFNKIRDCPVAVNVSRIIKNGCFIKKYGLQLEKALNFMLENKNLDKYDYWGLLNLAQFQDKKG